MLKLIVDNNSYDISSCYKTTAFSKATIDNQVPSISDFAVANLSSKEGNNQEHINTLRTLVGQSKPVVIKNENDEVVLELDTTYALTSIVEQVGMDGVKVVSVNFNKNC